MAHFAKLDENNIVIEVNVVNNEVLDFADEETSGITFLIEWSNGYSNWKQTSYNATFRKNFAGTGYYFDEARDAFIAPKPFESWLLDEETCRWQAPTPYPTDGQMYRWVEDDLNWQVITPTE